MGSQRVGHDWATELNWYLYKLMSFFSLDKYPAMELLDGMVVAQCKESSCQYRRHGFDPWIGKIPWRRKLHPTPVFLPGKSHGERRLSGYSPWGRKRIGYVLEHNCAQSYLWSFLWHFCEPTRLLCLWDFPGKNNGGGDHFLLQVIFPTQGSNLHFLHVLHWQANSFPLCHLWSPNQMVL